MCKKSRISTLLNVQLRVLHSIHAEFLHKSICREGIIVLIDETLCKISLS